MEEQMFDAVIVGAGPAGLAAALTLGRMRRSVLVIDSGHPRNARATSMHNFFSRDGDDPAAVTARARDDLERYESVELLDESDRKSTRLNSSHVRISYAVFCLKKKRNGRVGRT